MNPYPLSGMKDCDPDMGISVFTNGEKLDYKQSGKVDLLPLKVFYRPYFMTNILAFVDFTSQLKVTMDTNNKPAMFFHIGPDFVFQFSQCLKGL